MCFSMFSNCKFLELYILTQCFVEKAYFKSYVVTSVNAYIRCGSQHAVQPSITIESTSGYFLCDQPTEKTFLYMAV